MTVFGALLLAVAFVVVGILVGARAADQRRDVGLLKAVGFTPRLIGLAFALESAVLGAIACVVGFAVGAVLAPGLAAASADTLLEPPRIAVNPWHATVAAAIVVPVLLLGAFGAHRRSARETAVEALRAADASAPLPRRAGGGAHAPVPYALGLNALFARRRRALLMGAAIALAAAMAVVALSLVASLDARPAGEPSDVPDELPILVYTLDAALLVIVLTTLVAVAGLAVRERMRDLGVLRTLGLTPRQLRATLTSGQVVLAAAASLVAVPLGLAFYLALYAAASGTTEGAVLAPWWALASVPVGAVLLAGLAVSLPARPRCGCRRRTRCATSERRAKAPSRAAALAQAPAGPERTHEPRAVLGRDVGDLDARAGGPRSSTSAGARGRGRRRRRRRDRPA